ncbi:chorismate mutase [Thermosyntropha sp.]|uniref:chorismate mutase n=1 Tax=Thermosyntropha sp. TaxID=2740820 RepID=UPI0025CF2C10|nr:chorismate mutase [Thermosyntropha sp.]
MKVRGIRGAITVKEDTPQEVLEATKELLFKIKEENEFAVEDIASILFTVTSDVRSIFPAQAARMIGWDKVPLLCFQEIEVPGALPKCIRVLVHINTEKSQEEIRHIYLREAKKLRQDLSS